LQPFAEVDDGALVSELAHRFHEEFGASVEVFFGLENAGHGVDVVDDLTPAGVELLVNVTKMIGIFS